METRIRPQLRFIRDGCLLASKKPLRCCAHIPILILIFADADLYVNPSCPVSSCLIDLAEEESIVNVWAFTMKIKLGLDVPVSDHDSRRIVGGFSTVRRRLRDSGFSLPPVSRRL